jgi:hypothetical protein
VGLALVTVLLVIDWFPEGMPAGFRRPLDKGLSQALRTLETPVDPGLLAAAVRPGRDACVFLDLLCRDVAFPLCATGHEKAGGKDGPGARQGIKQGEVWMTLGMLRAGGVKVCDGLQSDTELGHKGLPEEAVGGDAPGIGRQRAGLWRAWRRVVRTSAERMWWVRKKAVRVARRASWAALRVGQRLRKSQKSAGSLA